MRDKIPPQFRANAGDNLISSKDNNYSGTTHIRNTQSKPIKTTYSSETKNTPENSCLGGKGNIINTGKSKTVNVGASSHFKKAVAIDKKILSQANPSWRTTPKEGAPPFDPMGKANTQKSNQKESKGSESKPNGQRPWVTENSEKMDAITDAINKKQAQSKQESREQDPQQQEYDRSTGKGQFNASSDPKSHNRTTRDAQKEKSSAEAKVSRERTPPEYRAEPYPPKDDIAPNSGNESIKDKVQERFKSATGAFKEKWDHFRGNTTDSHQEPFNPDAKKPRSTMSSGFNKSSFEGGSQSDTNDIPNAQSRKPKPS